MQKKRNKRSTRVNTGRKRPPLTKVQLERKVNRLERLLLIEQLKVALWEENWDKKCPKGHLRRHDGCDLMCEITVVEPFAIGEMTLLSQQPRMPATGTMHSWMVDRQIGWFWRVPYQWWLKGPVAFWKRMRRFDHTGDWYAEEEHR